MNQSTISSPIKNIDKLVRYADYRHHLASEAAKKWQARKAFLIEYCRQNHYTEEQSKTHHALDWELNDAMDAWSWNEREAKRLDSLIMRESARAQLAMLSAFLERQNGNGVPSPRVSSPTPSDFTSARVT